MWMGGLNYVRGVNLGVCFLKYSIFNGGKVKSSRGFV